MALPSICCECSATALRTAAQHGVGGGAAIGGNARRSDRPARCCGRRSDRLPTARRTAGGPCGSARRCASRAGTNSAFPAAAHHNGRRCGRSRRSLPCCANDRERACGCRHWRRRIRARWAQAWRASRRTRRKAGRLCRWSLRLRRSSWRENGRLGDSARSHALPLRGLSQQGGKTNEISDEIHAGAIPMSERRDFLTTSVTRKPQLDKS